jgi:hypothetical protein
MKKITASILIAITILSCGKKDDDVKTIAPPTNIGTGKVNYNGSVDLNVTARTTDGTSYSLQGNGQTGNNTLSLFMSFPKKPTPGNYTPEKDNILVLMDISNGNVTLSNQLKPTEIVTVTVNGNHLEASFKDAKFDLGGITYTYTGYLSVD